MNFNISVAASRLILAPAKIGSMRNSSLEATTSNPVPEDLLRSTTSCKKVPAAPSLVTVPRNNIRHARKIRSGELAR